MGAGYRGGPHERSSQAGNQGGREQDRYQPQLRHEYAADEQRV